MRQGDTYSPMFQHNSDVSIDLPGANFTADITYSLKICQGTLCNAGNVIFQFSSVNCSFYVLICLLLLLWHSLSLPYNYFKNTNNISDKISKTCKVLTLSMESFFMVFILVRRFYPCLASHIRSRQVIPLYIHGESTHGPHFGIKT